MLIIIIIILFFCVCEIGLINSPFVKVKKKEEGRKMELIVGLNLDD